MSNEHIAALRKEYLLKEFDESHLVADPYNQFKLWFKEAIESEVNEPNAMMLATASANGQPHARIVLLKGFDHEGPVFFTNYQSDKGEQIKENNKVALTFFWPELERQVRIEGTAALIHPEQSDEYFYSRPIGSQIGAHVSPQSKVIVNRMFLEDRVREFEKIFSEQPLLRPEHWGGYVVKPHLFEFWQGRSSRLHDRFLFTRKGKGWQIERLAP
ncbi:MAG: pyridoxamine 5'-phosphate oxidase [Bacteroidia bacterium]|nr:pyridoxamine 5'-phosphate oxidase [Bacteroidia bacterium]